ncbi:hypothetical protein [Amycolatopsis sp. cg9]|uniref:hypothetical protein n=1 Tax=Amycolatopsis sp. cg9 TaxID=3238801 RepID=UPI003523A2AF
MAFANRQGGNLFHLSRALLREFAAMIPHYRRTRFVACVLITRMGLALAIFL